MAFRVLLDANVLVPFSLRDTLLRCAEVGLYDLVWSERILDKTAAALVRTGRMDKTSAQRLSAVMNTAFPEAMTAGDIIRRLEASMTNDRGDRHVLATAVAGAAEVIVTNNLAHFPHDACAPHDVHALSPDNFLLDLFEIAPGLVIDVLVQQVSELRRPPRDLAWLLDALERAGVGTFVQAINERW